MDLDHHRDQRAARTPGTEPSPDAEGSAWYALDATEVVGALGVDPSTGLSSDEVERRIERYGLNRLDQAARERRWHAFLRQFRDLMIIILLVAAAVSLVVTREWETPVVIVLVVFLNATIGFVQESRAEASLEALRQLTVTTATVRRDDHTTSIDAEHLVPGDIVILEAGAMVPADGRLLSASSLEVQEAALTGEAHAVAKSATDVVAGDAPLAERVTAAFMGTSVTRGRGQLVVTATGMATETGDIAGLLTQTTVEPTPLQRQIDGLGRTLAAIAGVVVVFVLASGLARGQEFGTVFVTAVALAVAAIPEGLPAVVAFTLAMGTGRLAQEGAIVKRLDSVETLGSTSQICTDKTGTLTLNEMTAREVLLAGRRFTVSGEGYQTEGRIRATDGHPMPDTLFLALVAVALCTDAVLDGDDLVGEPTEGALVVLAEKGGVDVKALRADRPRLADVPFDSDYKFMATFHAWTDDDGHDVVRGFVKGAPDVLAAMSDRYVGGDEVVELDDAARQRFREANHALAEQGMRVLAVGQRDIPADQFDPDGDLRSILDGIVLVALIGIVDPPRPEARQAIAECRGAGIHVRMVTGDHALTAGAVAADLGIPGVAVTGADLDAIDDDRELAERLQGIGVVARVSPTHKIRIVKALQLRGDVVAMTGDGVNDAPALRKADIGVAMGVTGTEVTKEAATMVLTDDNFATIVRAVREGRGIYDNIVKFTRFQVSTAIGFVLTFLVASLTGLAGGAPFTALQILFVNLVMDGPPAMSLGVDRVSPDAMSRRPRPSREKILTRPRLVRIILAGTVMAVGTLAVLMWAPGPDPRAGEATVAGTMAFATFVFFQIFNLLNVRDDTRSVFSWDTLHNKPAVVATAVVLGLLVLLIEWDVLNAVFSTTNLTASQWLISLAVGSTILWTSELVKLVLRAQRAGRTSQRSPSNVTD